MFKVIVGAMLILGLSQATCKKTASSYCNGPATKDCLCTMEYQPVCGCDGKVYANACLAKCAGVKSWKEGECK